MYGDLFPFHKARLNFTMSDDDGSFSLLSSAKDIDTIRTPSESEHEANPLDLVTTEEETSHLIASSCTTSVSPSIYDFEYEHGRRYHAYRAGRYPLPNDQLEQQREDIEHAVMLELTVRIDRCCLFTGYLTDGLEGWSTLPLGHR